MTETVIWFLKVQRAGEGESPVQVETDEDHS